MQFDKYFKKQQEFGVITKINFPLATVKGLNNIGINELLLAENLNLGYVYSIQHDEITVAFLDNYIPDINTKVVKINTPLSIFFSPKALGKVIDPLGRDFYKKEFLKKCKKYNLYQPPLKISKRRKIRKQMHTGVLILDLIFPLGKGQRELIIGAKKTGKSALLKMIAKSIKKTKDILIYTLIGKKTREIQEIKEFLEKEKVIKQTIIVASTASDSPVMISLTPETAIRIAEIFRDKNIDTIVMFDDLSIHAKFYREISLLAKKYPGRESYPGDIFFTHARLLERAGNFWINKKETSITALPIAESLEDDITGFIQTNLMSITDGHIFLDPQLFNEGKRPAINPYLSVTRVGKQTQSHLEREINLRLFSLLSSYNQAKKLAHLSSELSENIKYLLKFGESVEEIFQQYIQTTYSKEEEISIALVLLSAYEKQKYIYPNKLLKFIKSRKKPNFVDEAKKSLKNDADLSEIFHKLQLPKEVTYEQT